ncbi:MAG: hypothetical protein JST84_23375 [Acidobacteria bacterium]|nr:hypothetical protein [Acidobacteriota bacterium]
MKFRIRTVFLFTALLLFITTMNIQAQNRPSEQKTGSVLVFPYYTSNDDSSANTLMNISNFGTTSVIAHLYFLEGVSCTQQDTSVYLTPNATLTLDAAFDVPLETGYLIVVAVDQAGCVIQNGGLSGSAFVKAPAGYFGAGSGETRGNYGALAFNAYTPICPAGGEITLNFNGTTLDAMPTGVGVSVQNPNVAPGQTIVLAGLNGSISDGNVIGGAQVGTGAAYSANEVFRSFSAFILGTCQGITTITNSTPRIAGFGTSGLSGLIAPGTAGILKFNTAGGAGLLITPRNNAGWSGLRQLTYTRTSNVTLKVPVF